MTFDETGFIAKLAWQTWQTRRLASCVLKISLRAIIALSRVKSCIRSKSTSLTASTHLTWKITELSCIAHCALRISHRIRVLSSNAYFTFGCILICVCLASRTLVTFDEPRHIAKLARQAWQTRCLTRVRLKVPSWTVRTISRVHLTGCSERTDRTLVTFDETGFIAKLARQAWQA